MFEDEAEGYDIAQVCPNGHPANGSMQHMPEFNKEYCEACGEKTITECPHCKTSIRGEYWGGGIYTGPYEPPAYCHSCGSAFPWTERRIQAAHELAVEVGSLGGKDIEQFDTSVGEIVRDTAGTQVAAHRMRKLLGKMGKEAASGIRSILVDIASETARKIIWPQG